MSAQLGDPLGALRWPAWAADAVTGAGLVAALGAAGAAAAGRRRVAAVAWTIAAVADAADGTIARSGGSRPGGAFRDSVADRISDAAIATGVVARELLAGRRSNAVLAAAAGMSAALPSYVTAKAQAEGLNCERVGSGRLERSAGWLVALSMPRSTGAVSAVMVVASVSATCQRFIAAYEDSTDVQH